MGRKSQQPVLGVDRGGGRLLEEGTGAGKEGGDVRCGCRELREAQGLCHSASQSARSTSKAMGREQWTPAPGGPGPQFLLLTEGPQHFP